MIRVVVGDEHIAHLLYSHADLLQEGQDILLAVGVEAGGIKEDDALGAAEGVNGGKNVLIGQGQAVDVLIDLADAMHKKRSFCFFLIITQNFGFCEVFYKSDLPFW